MFSKPEYHREVPSKLFTMDGDPCVIHMVPHLVGRSLQLFMTFSGFLEYLQGDGLNIA
jgi:hypothetical protein